METPIIAALIGLVGALSVALLNRWFTQFKNPQDAINSAVDFVRQHQLSGNRVKYRNSKWRRLRSRLSIMVDVCGPKRGVYLILIDRTGRVINIHQLRGWNPKC